MDINKKKKIAAGLSIFSNISLTALKLIAGFLSGSSVIKSSEPADKDHPFGHGKYEDLAGFIEGALIIFASLYILYESAKKIILGTALSSENHLGIAVMLVAVIANIIVSSILFKTAKESNSISLYADGEHLRTDVYSSVGVLMGLILIKITKYTLLDPIIAILVAVFIYRTGYNISRKALMNLVDHSLPNEDIKRIKNIIKNNSSFAKLKTGSIRARRTGPSIDIDIILQFPHETTICECHKVCENIERQIQLEFTNSSISIHSEPICYSKNCQKKCKT